MSLLEAICIKETFSAEEILRKLIYVSPVSFCQGTGYLIFSFTLLHSSSKIVLWSSFFSFHFQTTRITNQTQMWLCPLYQSSVTSYFIHALSSFLESPFMLAFVFVEHPQSFPSTSLSSENLKHLSSCEIALE